MTADAPAAGGSRASGVPPLLASLVVRGARANELFRDGAGPDGGRFFLPWAMLRERFAAYGVELNTPDVNAGRSVAFELHLNAQRSVPAALPCYTYLYENSLVRPLNAARDQLLRYRRVFTWNEDLIDGEHFLRLPYPNELQAHTQEFERDLHCVLIASNKALLRPDARNLHDRRVQVIRAFESLAPQAFSLYGRGWNQPAVRPGLLGRIVKRLQYWRSRWAGTRATLPFPSYRGTVHAKDDVLRRARVAIAFENARAPGYVTEKIFDCLRCGCIPVYIGPDNIDDYIPPDCYIDGDRFPNAAELVAHVMALDEEDFAAYRHAMEVFLQSPASQIFSNEHFCATIVRTICEDLGLHGIGVKDGPSACTPFSDAAD